MPPERVRGRVINVHALGATVRLDDGRLAAVPIGDVNANRAAYTRAAGERDGKVLTSPTPHTGAACPGSPFLLAAGRRILALAGPSLGYRGGETRAGASVAPKKAAVAYLATRLRPGRRSV